MSFANEFADCDDDRKRILRSQTRSSTLIATMLANELVYCDEGRMTTFVDRDDDREQVHQSR